MPILSQECDLYPDNLLSSDFVATDCRWWVLYTLSRREKELMRRLRSLEISFYGPVIANRGRSAGGRARTSYLPLFPNYVFAYTGEAGRYESLTTNCVSRCLEVTDQQGLHHDLAQIQRLIESGLPLKVEHRLEPGRRVRICSGMLAGQEGIVIRRRDEERLLVAVNFLQQGASILLDDIDVEPIG